MKLLHIADLHIGKRVNEFNMLEEQQHILEQILNIIKEEETDGILIAGDVYDKSLPSGDAVELLDEFLTQLTEMGQAIFLISGNHDSPERLGFGSRILKENRLYNYSVYNGKLDKITLEDEYGEFNVYLLPFIKPAMLKPYFEQPPLSYDEAVRLAISAEEIDREKRNILVAHQFVIQGILQPERSDSESLSVGGLDQVDASAFDSFDYVALGHLHRSQRIGRDTIRYAGSPLKYSFSEARFEKSATLLTFGPKGDLIITKKPLIPIHDLREIKGPLVELLRAGREETDASTDYIHATLTDEEELYDAIGQLRQVYPNLMVLDFDNLRNKKTVYGYTAASLETARKSPLELFSEFYQIQNNQELSKEQLELMTGFFEEAGGDRV